MINDLTAIEPVRMDSRKFGILACCMLLTMTDGFDTQSIGFVGPAIIRAWHLAPAMLGPIFSAGLFGALVGAITLGGAGDRHGRLRVLTFAILLFAGGTLATVWVEGTNILLVVRFLTGVGLGGALPNLLALTAGQVPARRRSTSVSIVIIGIPLGASVGGFASAALIEAYGWQSVFVMGGVAPLPILLILLVLMSREKALADGKITPDPVARPGRGAGFAALLAPRYRAGTMLLCAATFFSVMLTYTLVSWLPTLLTERGFSMRQAVLATVLLNFGSVFGGVAAGRLSDTRGPYAVIVIAYLLGGAAIAMIGVATGTGPVFLALSVAALFALGAQTGIGTLSATFYDASLRATGIGVALGVGRLGAVFGPLLIGILLAGGTGIATLFFVGGGEAAVIALLIAIMGYATRRQVHAS